MTGMTPARMISVGMLAISIAWGGWLLKKAPNKVDVAILSGAIISASDLAVMEAAFHRKHLVDYRITEGRIFVPNGLQSAYTGALVEAEALPRQFGSRLRSTLEKNSPWQSRTAQADLLRVAIQEELALVLRSMPGIENASVLYDVEERTGLQGGTVKTASVSIRPKVDMPLDPGRVEAVRVLVAASIAGMLPEMVAVTDLESGRVYTGSLTSEPSAKTDGGLLDARIAFERHLAEKIRRSLGFVTGAVVTVNVELNTVTHARWPQEVLPPEGIASIDTSATALSNSDATEGDHIPARANAPAEVALPSRPSVSSRQSKAPAADSSQQFSFVGVSVAVPQTYFQSVFEKQLHEQISTKAVPLTIQQFQATECERIRQHVTQLLPATSDPSRSSITVTGFLAAGTSVPHTPSLFDEHSESFLSLLNPVSREIWLAAMSVVVGCLSACMWWFGSPRSTSPSETHIASIDWGSHSVSRKTAASDVFGVAEPAHTSLDRPPSEPQRVAA